MSQILGWLGIASSIWGLVHQQMGDRVFLRWSAGDAHLFESKSETRIGGCP